MSPAPLICAWTAGFLRNCAPSSSDYQDTEESQNPEPRATAAHTPIAPSGLSCVCQFKPCLCPAFAKNYVS